MSAIITAAVAVTVGTAYSIYQGEKASKQQQQALELQRQQQELAMAESQKQAKYAEEATNKAMQKSPDTKALLSSAEQAAKAGGSSTMLTGSTGVDPLELSLSRKTLLGG